MLKALGEALQRIAMEPPFRIVVRSALRHLNVSLETRAKWDLSDRPPYLLGVFTAALQAKCQNVDAISVVEFGVAGGKGLLALQNDARDVEAATGVEIKVYGFDMGSGGLPEFIGDYRDHPEMWKPGDFPMDEEALMGRLSNRTRVIFGNVKETVESFYGSESPPALGFVSFDLDLYSSTRDALAIFRHAKTRMLWHVPLYFDDIDFLLNHRFAGELLAIDEFNENSPQVKIDKWYGVKSRRPFPERHYLRKMFVAHDLESISKVVLGRNAQHLPLR